MATDNLIRAFRDRYWPFRSVSECQAWNTQNGRLFLYTSGIGEHQMTTIHEPQELQIAKRFH